MSEIYRKRIDYVSSVTKKKKKKENSSSALQVATTQSHQIRWQSSNANIDNTEQNYNCISPYTTRYI